MHAKQNQDLGIASNEGRESYTTAKDSLVRVCIEKRIIILYMIGLVISQIQKNDR